MLALVMDSAIEVTGAERGFIMLANPAGELEFKIGRAPRRVPLPGKLFDTSQKIPQQVFATDREMIVDDLLQGSLAGEHLGHGGARYPPRALHAASRGPLCGAGGRAAQAAHRPIGVLYLDSHEKGRLLSTTTRHALEAFATEAGAAA